MLMVMLSPCFHHVVVRIGSFELAFEALKCLSSCMLHVLHILENWFEIELFETPLGFDFTIELWNHVKL